MSDTNTDAQNDVDGSLPADADPELVRSFWVLVAVFNAAVLATSVGVLTVVFTDDPRGYAATAVGVVLFVAGYRRYRRVRDDDVGPQTDS